MKKTIYILILSLTTTICFSQVGIGTVNPQKELHIAGSTSTIRIESLNATNKPIYNDGIKKAPAYVDGNGDITLGNGTGPSGISPLNFLIQKKDPEFVFDNPYGNFKSGTVINNVSLGASETVDTITTVIVTVPQEAILEIKYGITTLVSGGNLKIWDLSIVEYDRAIVMQTYIKVDLNSDGLSGEELTKIYGRTAQYYVSNEQGIIGYTYINGQAYLKVPAGTHKFYFYGLVGQGGRNSTKITSVGFGGAQDYLKIRVYN